MNLEHFFPKVSNQRTQGESSGSSSKFIRIDLCEFDPPSDPGKRPQISDSHPNIRQGVRRAYLEKGPCQPRDHNFPERKMGIRKRAFSPIWFNEFGSWLEYSIEKDAIFCLHCFLFKSDVGGQGGGDAFVSTGWRAWNKGRDRLERHVGDINSSHMTNVKRGLDLMNQRQGINSCLDKHSEKSKKEYRIRMAASLDVIRMLLRQGSSFRAHDESLDSSNKGNYREWLDFLANHNEEIKNVVGPRAPKNLQLTSPDFQKEMAKAAANETTKAIINELGDDLFAILVDESRDISSKEQMALVIRFVGKDGSVIERFLGIVHVLDTAARSLKEAMLSKLMEHNLCLSRIRGQGYDGASNMRGEYNGLKSLILRESPSAYYVHCFAHQLQLTLVAVAKNHSDVVALFILIGSVQNTVGASCKRRDMLRESQAAVIARGLSNGEIETGQGLNQEIGLSRAGDTRWGSHYGSLNSLIKLWTSVIDVLEVVEKDGSDSKQRWDARVLLNSLQTFDFIFTMHLMQDVLGYTNELSQALQRKEQDIVNAMGLVKVVKMKLQDMRDNGWDSLLRKVSLFCNGHNIPIPDMEAPFLPPRARRRSEKISNMHRYHVQIFNEILDMQLLELNERFSEISSELLICISCLNPRDSFQTFDKDKLIQLASFYPKEFETIDTNTLGYQLDTYILDVRSDERFRDIRDLNDLSKKLVETKKNLVFPYVYLLLKLALILPVATATVERAFSAMKFIKTNLRNRMGDSWLNDCLVTYIEKDVFDSVPNEVIMQHYQNMRTRREELSLH